MSSTMDRTAARAPSLPGRRPPSASSESARVCSRRNSIVNAGSSGAGAGSVVAGSAVGPVTAGAAGHVQSIAAKVSRGIRCAGMVRIAVTSPRIESQSKSRIAAIDDRAEPA
jgi:hypothetical protein